MNWLRNFMMGRYGVDRLNIVLLASSLIISLIARLARLSFLMYISYIPLVYCIFRMFSKNVNARIQENYKFLKYYNPSERWVKNKYNMIKGLKTYKYFKCPNCKQTVRVPRKKGRVNIICPKCNTKFTRTT